MNAKQLFAASALVFVGASAFATEGTQWVPTMGSLTRAEVKAELARAQAAGELAAPSATYGSYESAHVAKSKADAATALSRDDVRSEAASNSAFARSLYVGG